jgi:multiple sugar transport system permease protein
VADVARQRQGRRVAGLPLPRITYWQRDRASGYGFIGPQLLGFLVFVLGPILAVFWFSLHEWNLIFGNFEFTGLGNYQRLLTDPDFGPVAVNSALFAVGYVPLNVLLGLFSAVAVNRAVMGLAIFRTIYFAPVVVSIVAWTIVWRFMLQGDGVINGFIQLLTGSPGANWLREPDLALAWVVIVQVLKTAGLSMILFLAALQGIPREYEEAARVDGANGRNVFFRITLPLITPFIFLVTALSVINSLKTFALIYLLTRGGPGNDTTVLAYYIYEVGFQRFEMGYASTLAVVLFVVVMALTVFQFALRKRWVYAEE